MIRIKNLVKTFGATTVLHGLDLEIGKGEFFCFLGPNGAGKTTTIKILTGLLLPTSGRALVGGHDVALEPLAAKRLMAYIPDHPFLYGKLTAMEFLEFVAGLYELPRTELMRRGPELLDQFGIGDDQDRLVEDFSHGMRQKLVFAAAFLHRPEVLVVDEPWVGLDPLSIRSIKRFLKEETAKGLTIFMSTHTLTLAQELSDRIGILHRGELLSLGTAESLLETLGGGDLEDAFLAMTADEAEGGAS